MSENLSPGSYIRRKRKGPLAPRGVATGRGAMFGLTEKGPINKPTLITSEPHFVEVFGEAIEESNLADAVTHFFANGGEALYVSRVEHYSNPAVAATLEAVAASTDLPTGSGAATPGSITSSAASFPAYIPDGTLFDGSVDGVGSTGFTIQATPASMTLTGGTYAAGAASDSLTITVAGVLGPQVIDLSATAATRQSYIDALNAQLVGARAAASGGNDIVITTDIKGSAAAASITAIGGAAAAKTGASVGAFNNTGPNNVANDRAVTAAEFKTLNDGGFAGSTVTVLNNGGNIRWASNTTGVSSAVKYDAPVNIGSLIPGLDTTSHTGSTTGGSTTAITVTASSEGAWGNTQKVTTRRENTIVAKAAVTPAGTHSQLALSSVARCIVGDTISVGAYRSVITAIDPTTNRVSISPAIVVSGGFNGSEDVIVETLTITTTDKYGVAQQPIFKNVRLSPLAKDKFVENVVNGAPNSAIRVTVSGLTPSGALDPRPIDVTNEYLGKTVPGVSAIHNITDGDFIGSRAAKTGLYAFDDTSDFLLGPSAPGETSVAILKGIESYVTERGDIFSIVEVPKGLQGQAAQVFVQQTANLASKNMAVYTPWVKGTDIRTNVATLYPPSGMVMGMYARTFKERSIGKAPAGVEDGRLLGAVGVEYHIHKPTYDILYPARINAIQERPGRGTFVFGSRTLDPTGEFGQINVEITFIVVQRVFDDISLITVFENNNPVTRRKLVTRFTSYLRGLRLQGVLQGASDDDAFFVVCDETNNTASVRASNRIVCRVGLAVEEPGEFVEITLERDTRALDAELAVEQTAI